MTSRRSSFAPSVRAAILALAGTIVLGLAGVPGGVGAQSPKKLIRIHTAGPNDLGVDNTMLAHQFASYVNVNSDSVEVKVFPNSQLGQSREVIEAMRLGSGASGTTGGPAEYAAFGASVSWACRSCGSRTNTRWRRWADRSARGSRPTWRRPASRCSAGP